MARPGDGSVKTRRVALLVADGIDGASLRAVHAALAAAGAVPRFVGARLGVVRPASGDPIHVEVTMETAPAVLWDGVVVPGGDAGLAALGQAVDFVKDQYRHCKTILVLGAKSALVERATLPAALPDGSDDPGLLVARSGDAASAFIAALARHRHYERETDPPRSDASARHALAFTPSARTARGRAREDRAEHLRGRFSRKTLVVDIVIAVVLTALIAFVVFNAQSSEKKIEHQIEHLYRPRTRSSSARWACLLGPAIVAGNRDHGLRQRRPRSSPRCSTAIRCAQADDHFETYIYWSGDDRQGVRRRPRRARARRRQGARAARLGRHAARWTTALLDEMKTAGVEVAASTTRCAGTTSAASTTARTASCWSSTARSASPAASASPTSGLATRRTRSTGATRTSGSKGPVVAQMQAAFMDNWIKTTRRGAARRRVLPAARAGGRRARAQVFKSSPSGGSESMRLMYLLSIAAAADERSASRSAYFVPDELADRRRWSRR